MSLSLNLSQVIQFSLQSCCGRTIFYLIFLAFVLAFTSCGNQQDVGTNFSSSNDKNSASQSQSNTANGGIIFREIQEDAGLKFQHRHGGTGNKYFIETMGSGGGFLDFDGDGWQDIYLVQSGSLPGVNDRNAATNRLFRNQRDGTFIDVTEQAGVGDTGYGMGCSFGDYNNDGHVDIYITNFGPNQLYRNNGDLTFTNVTEQSGVGDERWGVSAAFADYDQDGDLDLYVVNYVKYLIEKNIRCGPKDILVYCHPDVYPGCPDILYRNEGEGTFTDKTAEAGVFNEDPNESKGLGVAWCDFDNDGDQDIYIANDSTPNFLYRNNGDGTFVDIALEAGTAYNVDGQTEAGMGIDFGDYNWDGYYDIFITHLNGETNTLYHNHGNSFFEDYTFRSKLGVPSVRKVGFGTGFLDYDNDGWLDIFVANGHIIEAVERINPNSGVTYAQSNQLYLNNKTGGFVDISLSAGEHFQRRHVSRGAAFGDIDNDGDIDILVTNNNQKAVLLENLTGQKNDWIGFVLKGNKSNRDAIGARIEIKIGEKIRSRQIRTGSSYLCQNDLRIVFGLDQGEKPDAVWIKWPNGQRQKIASQTLQANAYNFVEESASENEITKSQ